MATGIVQYWNGSSGWIERTDVADKSTAESGDVMLLSDFVDSGTIENGAAVTFEIREGVAYHVTVDARGEPDKPPPDSPPDQVEGMSP